MKRSRGSAGSDAWLAVDPGLHARPLWTASQCEQDGVWEGCYVVELPGLLISALLRGDAQRPTSMVLIPASYVMRTQSGVRVWTGGPAVDAAVRGGCGDVRGAVGEVRGDADEERVAERAALHPRAVSRDCPESR